MIEFVGLRAKTYSYLIDDGSKGKKSKRTKKCVIKRKLKLEYSKNYLEASQLENKINHLEKNHNLKEDHNELIKNNKLILKTQQRFRSEKHRFFTKEFNKIALSSNDDKRKKLLIR